MNYEIKIHIELHHPTTRATLTGLGMQ